MSMQIRLRATLARATATPVRAMIRAGATAQDLARVRALALHLTPAAAPGRQYAHVTLPSAALPRR
jgi:hypothetical protein